MYQALFPEGSKVRISSREKLEAFLREWRFHHKLEPQQLKLAGATATVKSVSFYHGGDALYQLGGISGTWHECCLETASEDQLH